MLLAIILTPIVISLGYYLYNNNTTKLFGELKSDIVCVETHEKVKYYITEKVNGYPLTKKYSYWQLTDKKIIQQSTFVINNIEYTLDLSKASIYYDLKVDVNRVGKIKYTTRTLPAKNLCILGEITGNTIKVYIIGDEDLVDKYNKYLPIKLMKDMFDSV